MPKDRGTLNTPYLQGAVDPPESPEWLLERSRSQDRRSHPDRLSTEEDPGPRRAAGLVLDRGSSRRPLVPVTQGSARIGGKGSWVDRAAEVRRGQNMRKRICHSAMSDGDRFGSGRGRHPYHHLEDWLVPSERCKKAYWCPANGDVLVDHVQYLLGTRNTEVRLIHGV
ncbi:hypothetical protein ASPSYDRAFT_94926 [Aspergillus sydowii CBS 593.65]|uniref:Uncharacterized protein n=1 Tax=Aspergillus sydowii CBS 593.65 TaxID=1036612 RepID=A0A1L9T110_9EURO|nr:uncharacterized protein ASPSYDRAFT_94926 [Aspergillus sydowii CBS 593.65]OJJ53097.1 hypothetical protein ASPSYDRAFT_94926 [Aspergillus sydowii CBS 593.65]